MNKSIFNDQMSTSEATYAFAANVDGKSTVEIEQLRRELMSVLPEIIKRESDMSKKGWLID